MHGRLKIKTTAEQAAEKKKEREEKRKLYVGGLNKAFDKRSAGVHDEEGLKIIAPLLMANPDAATLWNFRREIILAMKTEDQEGWDKVLQGELSVVEGCLLKNPKSYGAWHHRCWVMQSFHTPPWAAELALCDRYLKLDERNFHCWDYRRFVVEGSNKSPEEELKVSQQLIERNLSNYSAWHYRSKLLPLVHPPKPDTPHPIPEETLIKELQTVVEAVFTDPSDQSPWFFLRWLVNRQDKTPRLLQAGYIEDSRRNGHLVCVFSKPVSEEQLPQISLDGVDTGNDLWHTPNAEAYSHVWVKNLQEISEEGHTITFTGPLACNKDLALPPGTPLVREWMTDVEDDLSSMTRSTLEEAKNNCITLDELDPGNKWVLLTIVDVMWAIDSHNNQEKISSYLSQLQDLDPLRNRYYADMKSKLVMETTFKQHRMALENGQFTLNSRSLTRVANGHLLACCEAVDLSGNDLKSLHPLQYLVMCKKLNVDNNQISDLKPLSDLKFLEQLSLSGNKISTIEQLMPLQKLKSLRELNVSMNDVCEVEEVEEKIRTCLPQLQKITTS